MWRSLECSLGSEQLLLLKARQDLVSGLAKILLAMPSLAYFIAGALVAAFLAFAKVMPGDNMAVLQLGFLITPFYPYVLMPL